jgi:LPS-assembly protein
MAMRFAMLAAALAAAAPAAAQSAKPPAEADRTTIEADVIEGVSDLEVSGRGNAEIRRDDMTIFGESLRYNREFGRAEGEGGVRLQRGADRFFGPRLYYNTLDDTGVFDSPTYLLERDRTARGSAERLEFLGPDRYRFINANYTTCRPGQEDWRLEASELELDLARPRSTTAAFDTTILAAPYAVFDRRAAQGGLLTPLRADQPARLRGRNSVLLEHRARVRRHVHPGFHG